jgi:hypothetical protein
MRHTSFAAGRGRRPPDSRRDTGATLMNHDSSGSPIAAQPATNGLSLDEAVHSSSGDVLIAAAADPGLTEDLALALLKRPDLPAEVIEQLNKNGALKKSRKVKLAVVSHPRTPRHVSVPMVRHLFTFDLMQAALTPVVPADVKLAADDALISRLETVSMGEKLSLAHRASGRVAGTLLLDAELRVIRAALENPRLTESSIVRAIMCPDAPAGFVETVCRHPKWCLRHEVKIALLRNKKTPLARALELARALPPTQLRAILESSHLPANTKSCLLRELHRQTGEAT